MLNNLYISSINEVLLIAEKQNDIYSKLKSGEKVSCHVCNKGYLIPYNAHCDKAHSFICSMKNVSVIIILICCWTLSKL